uniref:Zinc finger, RAN-binding domain containing 3 n=1 Tax=Gouania willdenowi TaxID=441366 RepID=A0A8C5DUX2_GOUWI
MDDDGPQTSRCETRWSRQLSRLPHRLLQRLMPFQREGVEFALSKDGRWMGLGKTVQAIAVACAYRGEWPLLVVTPSSLKYPWIEELERWVPELQPGDINLVESKTDTISQVTVLGYGLLTTDAHALIQALNRRRFAVVVVDESHYLKSRNAARTKILLPLIQGATRAVLLTGTPALGRPEELFMQIEALYPKSFGTWSDYATKYCNAHYRYFGSRRQWDCRGASNLDELHQRLSRFMIRRLKADVLPQLPPKVRQRIPFDLPKEAAKEASASFAQWERLMKSLGSGVVAVDNPFSEVMGLVTQMYKQTAVAKAGAVKGYIKMMLEAEQLKFLVFAHHLTMLQACTEALVEAKVGYIRIDGSVPSSERIKLVHKFQNDPGTRVAVLSIQAAGQGLTLTAASHVVFSELYWNPGHMKQAEDRAHRIGQTSSVNVHYLIANGTFDTVMWAMLNRKETVTGSTLNGKKEYLKADEGDKDKWEFLSFADVWTPSDRAPSLDGDGNDDIFFTHFEKEKQHDIRSFFSPNTAKVRKRKRKRKEEEEAVSWSCSSCTYSNSVLLPYCELHCSHCVSDTLIRRRPMMNRRRRINGPLNVAAASPTLQKSRIHSFNLSVSDDDGEMEDTTTPTMTHPVHPHLQFCASRHTDRVYLYSKDGAPLNLSFVPLNIKVNNWEELPEEFRLQNKIVLPMSLSQVLKFLQEWSTLSSMKQKLLRRSGILFHSPTLGLQRLASTQRPHTSTRRFLSRDQVSEASLSRAQQEGGSVRLVTKNTPERKQTSSGEGYLQAVDSLGLPLCLSCQQACPTGGGASDTCPAEGGAWDTAFCSHKCQEEFQLRSSHSYMRSRVLEAENGVCQHCGLNAHQLFLQVRDAPPTQRKELLENSWLAQLSLKQLNEMIRSPVEGDFWQVDHMVPVYGGGGQCSMENLQTLCSVCHRARTSQQATERSLQRKKMTRKSSSSSSDISTFFIRK